MVSSSSVRWWLTTRASSSTASSKASVSVPLSSSTASSASWPSACSSSPCSASCSVIASLAAQPGVDVLLLGERVRGVQRRERPAYGVAVGRAVPQVAQQRLEPAVVVEDQVDDVALERADRGRWGSQLTPTRYPDAPPRLTGDDLDRALAAGGARPRGRRDRGAEHRPVAAAPALGGAVRLAGRRDGARAHLADAARPAAVARSGPPRARSASSSGLRSAVRPSERIGHDAAADRPGDGGDAADLGRCRPAAGAAVGRLAGDRRLRADRGRGVRGRRRGPRPRRRRSGGDRGAVPPGARRAAHHAARDRRRLPPRARPGPALARGRRRRSRPGLRGGLAGRSGWCWPGWCGSRPPSLLGPLAVAVVLAAGRLARRCAGADRASSGRPSR